MKKPILMTAIMGVFFAGLAFAQNNPCPAAAGQDSMQQAMQAACNHGAPAMPGQGNCANWSKKDNRACWGPQCMMPMQHPFRHPVMVPLFLIGLCLLSMAIVNILLTVLVCMDMAQLGRFNALWIPILLLFGIPGTALYALFRIGDAVRLGKVAGG